MAATGFTELILTFGAVVSLDVVGVLLPPVQADLLAVGPALVVAELVVPGPAQGVAVPAEVVVGADHAVLVLQPGVALLVAVAGPLGAGVQGVLGGQAADQGVPV